MSCFYTWCRISLALYRELSGKSVVVLASYKKLNVELTSINPIARHAYMIYRLAVKTGQPQICPAKLS